ncbi:DNA-processing protein DprA [Candidatus Sumerlaeota bacterium]|nr:DNA-processing protein DprA [Candidatus Sumerlaeota bacterium]
MTGLHSPIQGASLIDPSFPSAVGDILARAKLGMRFHWRGKLELCEHIPRVGIIGTRAPSPAAEEAMESLAANLARDGAAIVSGAALGIDLAAHRGALKAGGATIACVPFGLETTDLATWRGGLLDPSSRHVLAISAFPQQQQVTTRTPVLRNRLIAALSQVIVIGEAGVKSGTHHCRRFAEGLGVPMFFLAGFDAGDKGLIAAQQAWSRRGATPFSADDVSCPAFLECILHAAAIFAGQEAAARSAQLRLFPQPPS